MIFSSKHPLLAFELMLRAAQKRSGNYVYVFPSRKLALRLVWEGVTTRHLLKLKLDHTNMIVYLENGSRIFLTNSHLSSVLGHHPVGVILFDLAFSDVSNYVVPPLIINKGWLIHENSHQIRMVTFTTMPDNKDRGYDD